MYVVIVETAKDSSRIEHKNLPPDYPTLCKEYENPDIARAENPSKTIMTLEQYKGYSWGMQMLFEHVSQPELKRPWWKVWGR